MIARHRQHDSRDFGIAPEFLEAIKTLFLPMFISKVAKSKNAHRQRLGIIDLCHDKLRGRLATLSGGSLWILLFFLFCSACRDVANRKYDADRFLRFGYGECRETGKSQETKKLCG